MKYIVITVALLIVGCGRKSEDYQVVEQTFENSSQNHPYEHIMTIPATRMQLKVYYFRHKGNDCYVADAKQNSKALQPTIACTR